MIPFVALLAIGTSAAGFSPLGISRAQPSGASAGAAAPANPAPTAPVAGPTRIAPGADGSLGAWLFLGPFRSATFVPKGTPAPIGVDALAVPPPGVDEKVLAPELGRVAGFARWTLGSSGDGPIDVLKVLGAREGNVIAYAGGTLHVERAGRYYLLVGADDGIRVNIDGKTVLAHDEPRPERDDDDLVALDLTAGDHPISMKLHQRDGGWALHVRLVDAQLAPPAGAYVTLPGTTVNDTRALATKMSSVAIDRGVRGDGYHPRLTVRYPEGTPLGVPLPVRTRLLPGQFDVQAGVLAPELGEMVVTLPVLRPEEAKFEDQDLTFETTVGERTVRTPFAPRHVVREAIAHADRTLASLAAAPTPGEPLVPPSWLKRGTLESVTHLRDRLANYASRGDNDLDIQREDAAELDAAVTMLDKKVDPYASRTGPQRRAYLAPEDGHLSEYGLYVPPSYKPGTTRKYPLIVIMHGLNGKPMAILRVLFGLDDQQHDSEWKDRHATSPTYMGFPPLEAFVVAPTGHGNTMYRHLGMVDVLQAIDEVTSLYPIDPTRVTATGPSMGGSGSAALALRHPDMFAAAAPLCGYHSYFVRRDFVGKPLRPWERALAAERSNSEWAFNGKDLPLFVVHGTLDWPEINSGVLIQRYEELQYSIIHEHPKLGHNVWATTYESFKGANWLLSKTKNLHPASIRFRTMRLRENGNAWLHIQEFTAPDVWGEVEARVKSRTAFEATTKGVAALSLDRDEKLVDAQKPITVAIDGSTLTFGPGDPLVMHREGAAWKAGERERPSDAVFKRGKITGPLRDAFHEPLLFVYGSEDPTQTRANEEVARAWARVSGGVEVRYPIMSDAEFFAKGEVLANSRALFLVGNAKSNRVVRSLEADFPIRIDGDTVVVGDKVFKGNQLGAAFIRPNPKRADRYVVVVEGADAMGTWRSLSLPDLIPDFVVYDEKVAPARGQVLLNNGAVLAAGFFRNDWSIPANTADPLARIVRPAARTEHDATPYLP
ncbi:prolyl oligopeptidase family serine peptidase [Pendulispora brunnea]|uniref:Prolyl oligopeptidase family serine peptidase n=1 Tax=Pendulispora brunnea TaxID=2905690 RepID=A0ABZ2KJA9_9BACT